MAKIGIFLVRASKWIFLVGAFLVMFNILFQDSYFMPPRITGLFIFGAVGILVLGWFLTVLVRLRNK